MEIGLHSYGLKVLYMVSDACHPEYSHRLMQHDTHFQVADLK